MAEETKKRPVKSLQIRGNSYHAKVQQIKAFYKNSTKEHLATTNTSIVKHLIDTELNRINKILKK